ncbi:hypothetical protein [Lysinibacillus sp. G4S2]|uniref:hypothetical protein n=1 Tax=Lysinibacillus sp. G4S2 TaxID=3055859 RepID=UPI0025A27E62|nr:hypothetical protein [Lysinibacillus sp. G4S2]MDM5247734.1 hypothetical protein [Lysinibacillus sp. G4S2]
MFELKNFAGLFKKEWVLFRAWLFVGIFAGIMLSLVIPYLVERFVDGFTLPKNQLSFALTMMVIVLGGFFSVLQFLASMRHDLKIKEIWLHSTSSISQLVGVKVIFSLIGYAIYNLIFIIIAMYNVKDEFVANFGQILLALILTVGLSVILQWMMLVMLLLFLAFYLQMKHFIGRFSIVIMMGAFFFSMNLWYKFTESQLYANIFLHIEIPLDWLEHYLPKAKVSTMDFNISTLYVVEEVGITILIAILFIVATKWLEKVVLR